MTIGSPVPAFRLLTRVPIHAFPPDQTVDVERSVAYFPIVGLCIGAALMGADLVLHLVWPTPVVSALVLVTLALLTGGFHLDGLMDSADGLLGQAEPRRRLEIMRDSHVGAFAVIAVVLILLVQYSALTALGSPTLWVADAPRWQALLLMGLLSRWAIVLLAARFPYARPSGTGKAIHDGASPTRAIVATLIAMVIAVALAGIGGLAMLALVGLVAISLGRYATSRLGGLTGDVYGAGVVISESTVLLAAPLLLHGQMGWPR